MRSRGPQAGTGGRDQRRRPEGRRPEEAALVRPRRRPLRHHLGLHQVDARQRPRRRRVLPGGMLAGGEDPKFIARRIIIFASRGRRQRRPGRARGGRGGGARRRVRRPARVPPQPEPGGALHGARPQEQRRLQGDRRGHGRRRAARQRDRRPRICATPTTAARASWATARGTCTRTPSAAGSSSSICPTRCAARPTSARSVASSSSAPGGSTRSGARGFRRGPLQRKR